MFGLDAIQTSPDAPDQSTGLQATVDLSKMRPYIYTLINVYIQGQGGWQGSGSSSGRVGLWLDVYSRLQQRPDRIFIHI